jgi:hypothetical protein
MCRSAIVLAGALELTGEPRYLAGRSPHHESHVGRARVDLLERVPTQEQRGYRGDLVGRHQPRANRKQ